MWKIARFNSLGGLCVLDNVRVPLTLRGETSAAADQRARALLAVSFADRILHLEHGTIERASLPPVNSSRECLV